MSQNQPNGVDSFRNLYDVDQCALAKPSDRYVQVFMEWFLASYPSLTRLFSYRLITQYNLLIQLKCPSTS